jgi:hypothetical protein
VEYTNVTPASTWFIRNQRQLEYDFRLAPGADAHQVALKFNGAEGLEVDTNGDLLIKTALGTVRQLKPVVYQDLEGERREVPGGYALKGGGRVGFDVGGYDTTRPLIIDPVLAYSTFHGAGGSEEGFGIAVDAAGNAYVTGRTSSANFPTQDAFDNTRGGGIGSTDAFVTKLNASGSALIYSTYLGGGGGDVGSAIAVDVAGNAYVTGTTDSNNFPRVGAFDGTLSGSIDPFVTKFNASGSALVY